jgi:hypothetical protein
LSYNAGVLKIYNAYNASAIYPAGALNVHLEVAGLVPGAGQSKMTLHTIMSVALTPFIF